jgi:hypothetical protein
MVTLASSIMVLVGYNANGHNVPRFDHENAAFPMILSNFVMVGSCDMTLVCMLIYHDSPSQRSRAHLGVVVVLAACSLSNLVGFFRFSPKPPERSECKFQWVPHTDYSIREFDQAVALGIGIATLLSPFTTSSGTYDFPLATNSNFGGAAASRTSRRAIPRSKSRGGGMNWTASIRKRSVNIRGLYIANGSSGLGKSCQRM